VITCEGKGYTLCTILPYGLHQVAYLGAKTAAERVVIILEGLEL
jgi:hypothetical protein